MKVIGHIFEVLLFGFLIVSYFSLSIQSKNYYYQIYELEQQEKRLRKQNDVLTAEVEKLQRLFSTTEIKMYLGVVDE